MARYTIEESFPSVWVEGEISNYHHHGSGHRYFTLKDDTGQLGCAMWRSYGESMRFQPKNGLKVIAEGSLTIYERAGRYQLSVRKLLPSGMGELELALRQLREKLAAEGIFDPDRKRPLPQFPLAVGIVTSPTGAVIHDIIRVMRRRNPKINLYLWPAEVQGEIAPPQLIEGVRRLNEFGDVDVIIIGRGGGSLEDLWAFNDEGVVRAVVESKIPVVSAVGHEADMTLTDLAADYSAATPSMAAEIVAWPLAEYHAVITGHLRDMKTAVVSLAREYSHQLRRAIEAPVMKRPVVLLENRYQRLDSQIRLLHLLAARRFDTFRERTARVVSQLESLSPLKVLLRGYSVSRSRVTGEVIRSVQQAPSGTDIETILPDGRLLSTVSRYEKGKS